MIERRELGSRIHVVGGAGAGKTTLARNLGGVLGLPHTDLDLGEADLPPSTLARRPAWVLEGIYLHDIEPVLERATTVIWLDLPYRVALRRILVRHVRLSLLRRNPHPGIRQLLHFALDQRDYYTKAARTPEGFTDWDALSRAQTERVLKPHIDKVVHLRSPDEVRRFRGSVLSGPVPVGRSRPPG